MSHNPQIMGENVQGDLGVSQDQQRRTHFHCSKKADTSLPSPRPLKVRHLKTAYGEFLDLQDRVVGDFFDDRGADGNIHNSILEVHRYPPAPDELETLQRFSSLAPSSSVRPRKRPLELPSHSDLSHPSQRTHRELPSIEDWDTEAITPFNTGTKRRRTDKPCLKPFNTGAKRQHIHKSRVKGTVAGHPESAMPQEHSAGPFHSSQNSGTQGSVHQVLDSQRSSGKKRTYRSS